MVKIIPIIDRVNDCVLRLFSSVNLFFVIIIESAIIERWRITASCFDTSNFLEELCKYMRESRSFPVTFIRHACGSLFVFPNTLSHSTLLKTTNSKRYKF